MNIAVYLRTNASTVQYAPNVRWGLLKVIPARRHNAKLNGLFVLPIGVKLSGRILVEHTSATGAQG